MGNDEFNPRRAAHYHAGQSRLDATVEEGDNGRHLVSAGLGDFASAIACGLIYVGDQLARANLLAEYRLLSDQIMDAAAASDELLERERALRYQLWPEPSEGQVGT